MQIFQNTVRPPAPTLLSWAEFVYLATFKATSKRLLAEGHRDATIATIAMNEALDAVAVIPQEQKETLFSFSDAYDPFFTQPNVPGN